MADNPNQSPPSIWSRSKRSLGGKGLTILQHLPRVPKGQCSLLDFATRTHPGPIRGAFYKYPCLMLLDLGPFLSWHQFCKYQIVSGMVAWSRDSELWRWILAE